MGRTKPTVEKAYVVGLTDGEGCFYVNIWKSPAYRAGYGVQVHFHLKMQEKDRDLLEKVKNTLGCGAVYLQKEKRANHCQCYRYTVSAQRDILNVVIPFFKKNPLQSASKQHNFKLFCPIARKTRAFERERNRKDTPVEVRNESKNCWTRVVREIRSLRGNVKYS